MWHTPWRPKEPIARTASVFIDGWNLINGIRDEGVDLEKVDFKTLFDELGLHGGKTGGVYELQIERRYLYITEPTNEEGKKLYTSVLQAARNVSALQVVTASKMKRRKDSYHCEVCGTGTRSKELVEKGLDVKLSTDMIFLAHAGLCNFAILVSGDGDLVPAVDRFKELGGHVSLAYHERRADEDLISAADFRNPIDKGFIQSCMKKIRKSTGEVEQA